MSRQGDFPVGTVFRTNSGGGLVLSVRNHLRVVYWMPDDTCFGAGSSIETYFLSSLQLCSVFVLTPPSVAE